ncbi:hypothetical protein [Mechercharimyces sp. CAU 1602]|uniref:hypothetical protein n=1 Tax=Mechercharimyces sp. CAU 1602 TaxID=2973933 RepID=UPI002163AAAA|nr:hypothetical protein [Mechercharimyces sp. CAU 1602]MCS1352797.1 hypothetical protein [Mechercharimyces sp. CAU 1602]
MYTNLSGTIRSDLKNVYLHHKVDRESKMSFGGKPETFEIVGNAEIEKKPNLILYMKPNSFVMIRNQVFYAKENFNVNLRIPHRLMVSFSILLSDHYKREEIEFIEDGEFFFGLHTKIEGYENLSLLYPPKDIAIWFDLVTKK